MINQIPEDGGNNTIVNPVLKIDSDKPLARLVSEPMTGGEVSKFIAQLYPLAGDRLGSHLVESNIVLTLAGVRGQTEFFISGPIQEDYEKINQLNAMLESKGVRVRMAGKTFKSPTSGEMIQMVNLESLRGYEHTSHITSIPGVIPFDASEGWEGFSKWHRATLEGLENAYSEGKFPYRKDIFRDTFAAGVFKGYPDQAIDDMAAWLQNNRSYKLAHTQIKGTGTYHEAQPNFLYHPDHVDNLGIANSVREWGNLLSDFYASPWHQKIIQDASFITARQPLDALRIN